jgi:phage shock protein E
MWKIGSAVLAALLVTGCTGGAPQPAGDQTVVAAPAAAASSDTLWVDVRTPAEFAQGHVRGALHIPVAEIEARRHELAAHGDRPIALYCRTGRRSSIALNTLRAHGFTNLHNLGAFSDLARAGVPTSRGLPD